MYTRSQECEGYQTVRSGQSMSVLGDTQEGRCGSPLIGNKVQEFQRVDANKRHDLYELKIKARAWRDSNPRPLFRRQLGHLLYK